MDELKLTAFGYKSAKELFEMHVQKKFEQLKDADIEQYYDFILASGALKDWIRKEKLLPKKQFDKFFCENMYLSAFYSIYNNAKHFILTDTGQKHYVILDGSAIGQTNGQGEIIIKEDTIFYANHYLTDKIIGDAGGSKYFCRIMCREENTQKNIYLYELCKQVYNKYREIFV